jgi:hypothetical protein
LLMCLPIDRVCLLCLDCKLLHMHGLQCFHSDLITSTLALVSQGRVPGP